MTQLSKEPERVDEPFALRTPQIIGRQGLLGDIRSAIKNKTGRSYIFYVVAPGGIGKTRLLEEVAVIHHDLDENAFCWSGIVDLYHTNNHSPGGLRRSIIEGLDPDDTYFHEYRALRKDFERKRAEGVASAQLQKLRPQLDEVFLWNYASLASQQRIVLCFDTLELLQYESDIVQELCQIQEVETVIKNWLLEEIGQLPNTVTLLAGRPRPRIEHDLAQSFVETGQTFYVAHLQALTQQETQAYLDSMRMQRLGLAGILSKPLERQIFQITRGRPIYLTLIVDLLLYGGDVGDIFAFPSDAAAAVDEAEVGRRLVERLMGLPGPLGEIIFYLLYARKGLDADLLHYLVGERWPMPEVQDNLQRVREFAFVKFRHDTRQCFLHDEVYDLFDRYFQDDPRTGQEYAPFARYYRQRLAAALSSRERAELMVTLLYYELQANTSAGYHRSFVRWDEEAIKGYELGLDMRLRDEMLRFLDRYTDPESPLYDQRVHGQIDRAAIDRDCAVRWVRRYLARGEPVKARRIAADLRQSQHPSFDWDGLADPLYQAGLLIAWGETMLYTGATDEETRAIFDQALEPLQRERAWKEEQQWLRARLLGRLHNNIGYLHWARGRNSQALAQYQRALPHFKTANIPDERADTLNNMAFTLALLGMVDDAQEQAKRALAIRQQLDRRYLIALSHNTRGYIYTLQSHPMWGERECREALRIFEELQEPRGIGLACNALGFTLRKRGDQWKLGETIYPSGEVEIYFDQAAAYLRRAVSSFTKQVNEPVRLWESYNELGSLYCDWGWLAGRQDDHQTALDHYTRAIDFQKQARTIAEEHSLAFQIVDSYDDLAQVYHDRHHLLTRMSRHAEARTDYALAEACLEKILAMVPQEFRLKPGQGFDGTPEPGDAYWLAVGKVELQQGIWVFRHIDQERLAGAEREEQMRRGIWHFALATGYFQRYWPQSQALGNTLRALASRLEEVGVDAEFARTVVQEAANTYRVDLDRLLTTIDNTLGV